jgi:hypothetical protein
MTAAAARRSVGGLLNIGLLTSLVLATSLPGQSFFAMRGLGEQVFTSDAASEALGGLYALSPRNPAYPIAAVRTGLLASVQMQACHATGSSGQRLFGGGRPGFFRARVPLPLGFGIGLGFSELYNQDFDVYSESLAAFRRHVTGQGGIYGLDVAVSKNFFDRLSLACEYNRLLGGSSEYWRLDASEGGYVTMDTLSYAYSGDRLRLALAGTLGPVVAAGFWEPVLNFSIASRLRTHGSSAESSEAQAGIPARWGGGVTFAPMPSLTFFLEGALQNSSAITIAGQTRSCFQNSWQGTLGAQYSPEGHLPVRIGLHYQSWYLKAAADQPIAEWAVSAGSSVPIAAAGAFDFALTYARRSSAALAENVLRAQLSLSYGEVWKPRARRWGY